MFRCRLRRTGGPSPGFGAYSSSPYTVPLCWVWGPGIAVLWSCQRIVVCDSVRLLYTYFTYLLCWRTRILRMAPSTSPKIVASFTKTRAAALTGAGFMGVTGTLARAIAGSRRIAAIASGRRVTERRASVAPADGLMQGRCLSAAESAGAPSDWVRSAAARRRPSRTRIGARFGNHIGSVDLSRSSLGGLVIGWAVVPVGP